MSLWILQPDAQGNCCDCAGRNEPCDSCGACGVCTVECVRAGTTVINNQTTPCTIGPLNDTECVSYNINRSCNGAPALVSGKVQTRLVITGLTAGIQTTAHIFFSDGTQHDFVFTPTDTSYTTEYVAVPFPALNADAISVAGCGVDCPCHCSLFVATNPSQNFYGTQQEAVDRVKTSGLPNLATAQAGIVSYTDGCFCFFPGNIGDVPILSKSAAFDASLNKVTILETVQGSGPSASQISTVATFSCSLKKNSVLTVGYNAVAASHGLIQTILVEIDTCNRSGAIQHKILGFADFGFQPSQSGSITMNPIPDDGEYLVTVISSASSAGGSDPPPPLGNLSSSFAIVSSSAFVVNPVISLYGKETSPSPVFQLEACPKMFIPPGESAGGAYVDRATAATAIANQSSNCVGFFDLNGSAIDSFSAVGGSTLVFTEHAAGLIFDSGQMWGSVLATAGDTLSFAWTGVNFANFEVYDSTNTLLFSLVGATNPLTTPALPYTGRYIVKGVVALTFGPPTTTITGTVSSSGTMSTCLIQALYDVGLTCPAHLNCS